ncbi:hypothetical protein QBC44DRAFT_319563 [Cladorrhinum sp. PSN332]|nr:hypothetical protein QBC44DRAFT_319563 [Cladorrhinum sp. PSN332]
MIRKRSQNRYLAVHQVYHDSFQQQDRPLSPRWRHTTAMSSRLRFPSRGLHLHNRATPLGHASPVEIPTVRSISTSSICCCPSPPLHNKIPNGPVRRAVAPQSLMPSSSSPSSPSARLQQLAQTVAMSSGTGTKLSACHGHNEACCNIPPVVATGYSPKGSYQTLGELKTYVTGPDDATRGIISIYDIFGFFDQTLQGADILAYSDENNKYKVFIPDWFKGKPCPLEWFPPDTEEKQQKVGGFFGNPANAPQTIAAALPGYVKALEAANPSIKEWALFGYCWGGKVAAVVTSSESNPFKIAGTAHPAMVDPADAKGITVPFILLASEEEAADTVKAFESNLKVPHHVETFGDQVHGFMAARADLSSDRVKDEYTRGYKTVLEFFGKHWQ